MGVQGQEDLLAALTAEIYYRDVGMLSHGEMGFIPKPVV